jgi:hypothetical protein
MIKSRRMRWVWYVLSMGEMKSAYTILVAKPEKMRHSEDLGIDWIILKWILGK